MTNHVTDIKDHVTDLKDHVTDHTDHVTDLQNHVTDLTDHVTYLKDHVTDLRNPTLSQAEQASVPHSEGRRRPLRRCPSVCRLQIACLLKVSVIKVVQRRPPTNMSPPRIRFLQVFAISHARSQDVEWGVLPTAGGDLERCQPGCQTHNTLGSDDESYSAEGRFCRRGSFAAERRFRAPKSAAKSCDLVDRSVGQVTSAPLPIMASSSAALRLAFVLLLLVLIVDFRAEVVEKVEVEVAIIPVAIATAIATVAMVNIATEAIITLVNMAAAATVILANTVMGIAAIILANTVIAATGHHLKRVDESFRPVTLVFLSRLTVRGYKGCYVDQRNRVFPHAQTSSNSMTTAVCVAHCRRNGYAYAGTQYASQCFCGTAAEFARLRSSGGCNKRCKGNSKEICGGTWRMSVYVISGGYKGCYVDQRNRVFPHAQTSSNSMTTALCVAHCRKNGYAFAGTQYASQCFCGTAAEFARLRSSGGCNKRCKGNSKEICGGTWRMSVYVISAKTYSEAQKRCEQNGGSLADLKTAEIAALVGRMVDSSKNYWIGLNDLYHEGRWHWSDGVPLDSCSYRNWYPGEPNNLGNEDCAHLWAGRGGKWNDLACNSKQYFICQTGDRVTTGCTGSPVSKPEYKGCYRDAPTRRFPNAYESSSQQSTARCVSHCKSRGFSYAGTQYSHQCFCGTDQNFQNIVRFKVPDSYCNKVCRGNPSEKCGGTWLLSVYKIAGPGPVNSLCLGQLTCPKVGMCQAWGDPHYITFDNRRHDFQGTCKYVLVRHADFTVAVRNVHRPGKSQRVAFCDHVEVTVYGFKIEIRSGSGREVLTIYSFSRSLWIWMGSASRKSLSSAPSVCLPALSSSFEQFCPFVYRCSPLIITSVACYLLPGLNGEVLEIWSSFAHILKPELRPSSRKTPSREFTVNGRRRNLPACLNRKVAISISGLNVQVQTDHCFTLTYDGNHRVQITVPESYKGKVRKPPCSDQRSRVIQGKLSGMCGNYNGRPNDDNLMPTGQVASTSLMFGNSWIAPDDRTCPDTRPQDNFGPGDISSGDRGTYLHPSKCGLLKASNGPFRSCNALLSPNEYVETCVFDLAARAFLSCNALLPPNEYVETCVFDMAAFRGDQVVLCQNLQAYADACVSAGGKPQPWRRPGFCAVPCPANSRYSACASPCPRTCADPGPRPCTKNCVESCVCNTGYVLSGARCVPLSSCGCVKDGNLYEKNEVWTSGNERCTCLPNKNIKCERVTEPPPVNPVCLGNLRCPGRPGQCKAWGDPHYITFDGRRHDFQGTCKYVLVRHADFTVAVRNVHRPGKSQRVAFCDHVEVNVHNYEIQIRSGTGKEVLVNGYRRSLPACLGRKVAISVSGKHVLIQTDQCLSVLYDGRHSVIVRLPTTYKSKVSGMCGNYNGRPNDDNLMPTGQVASTSLLFGNSWIAPDDETCPDTRPQDNFDSNDITAGDRRLYGRPDKCGLLQQRNGPFGDSVRRWYSPRTDALRLSTFLHVDSTQKHACISVLNPATYFESCVFDMAAYRGDEDMLCENLEAYSDDCTAAGGKPGRWRTANRCPMPCPEHSSYNPCGSACPLTCAEPNPRPCVRICVESCVCDRGYVLSGSVCVPRGSCGCSSNGNYYQKNEVWRSANQICKCTTAGSHVRPNQLGHVSGVPFFRHHRLERRVGRELPRRGVLPGRHGREEGHFGREWKQIDGNLAQISSGKGIVWGVNSRGKIYVRTGITDKVSHGKDWRLVTGQPLRSVCVSSSSNFVWGVSTTGTVWRRTGITNGNLIVQGRMLKTPVWGVSTTGTVCIWKRTGIATGNLIGTGWQQVPGGSAIRGGLSYVSIGYCGVWGRDVRRKGLGGTGWAQVTGYQLVSISVGYNVVWGVSAIGQVFIRIGPAKLSPGYTPPNNGTEASGTAWRLVGGSLTQIYVSSSSNRVWGCGLSHHIYLRVGITWSSGPVDVPGRSYGGKDASIGQSSVQPTCHSKADIHVLVDGSKSVQQRNFPSVRQFILKLAAGFEIGPGKARIGVYQFAKDMQTEFKMNQYNNRAALLGAIRKIEYMNKLWTRTGQSLKAVYNEFTKANGARDDAEKIIILVTDGKATDQVREPAQYVKNKGAHVFTVGVAKYKMSELQLIASNNDYVATADDFEDLDRIRDKVLDVVCNVYNEAKTYTEAQKRCEQNGGSLADLKTAEISAVVVKTVDSSKNYWIGLNDLGHEGRWHWSDGVPLDSCSFKNWYPGEPNNVGNEDCAHLWAGRGGKWNDLACSSKQYFICQTVSLKPEYKGCYRDTSSLYQAWGGGWKEFLNAYESSSQQSTARCVSHCKSGGFSYAGDKGRRYIGAEVENGLQYLKRTAGGADGRTGRTEEPGPGNPTDGNWGGRRHATETGNSLVQCPILDVPSISRIHMLDSMSELTTEAIDDGEESTREVSLVLDEIDLQLQHIRDLSDIRDTSNIRDQHDELEEIPDLPEPDGFEEIQEFPESDGLEEFQDLPEPDGLEDFQDLPESEGLEEIRNLPEPDGFEEIQEFPESEGLEEFRDLPEPDGLEEFQDIPESDGLEEIRNLLESDGLEEFQDLPEPGGLEEFQDLPESDDLEEFQELPEPDGLEEFQDLPESEGLEDSRIFRSPKGWKNSRIFQSPKGWKNSRIFRNLTVWKKSRIFRSLKGWKKSGTFLSPTSWKK
ncbi:hypothetical protein Bbelb_088300 [Branchiostoma belcheri]|nr:hypothetical protein Bbelb_088300 [Branchiostoma belcheri]